MRQAKVAGKTPRRSRGREGSALTAAAGQHLVGMCSTAALWLERNAAAIDALNVFPVPDGDTGTNMLLTLRAAVAEARGARTRGIAQAAEALAYGALMGARGNSGVILSQFFQGLAQGMHGLEVAQPRELAQALAMGSQAAYNALSQPVEGTILTVARDASKAAVAASTAGGDLAATLAAAAAAAAQAVERTPQQLPVLREAGVVDAGGQGFRVILEGAAAFLRDGRVRHAREIIAPPAHSPIARSQQGEGYGFCTELVVHGQELAPDQLRQWLGAIGTSVMVVGDPAMVRVHVHTATPQAVVDYASHLGLVDRIKIEDMDAQHQEARRRAPPASLGVVAVAWGEGFAQAMESLGARPVVRCGETMNPSLFDLLTAIEDAPAAEVVLLPNNANVLPAARQVGKLTAKRVFVLSTQTLPQGVAALLAYNSEATTDANLAAMEEARQGVRTLEVTRASRGTSVAGRSIRAGQAISLLEGRIVGAAGTEEEALRQGLAAAGAPPADIVTIYYGEGQSESQTRALADRLRQAYPSEWEVLGGGQPHYSYILSLE